MDSYVPELRPGDMVMKKMHVFLLQAGDAPASHVVVGQL